jgi:hypothetical protein
MSTIRIIIVVFSFIILLPVVVSAQGEEEKILQTVRTFFDGMAEADSVKLASVMMPGGVFISVREEGDEWTTRTQTIDDFLRNVGGWEQHLYERMWNPKVLRHGHIAVIWTPYDFYIDGEFSHCGKDAFNLIKTDTGWVIASAVYTVERTGCPESPLGPPDFSSHY